MRRGLRKIASPEIPPMSWFNRRLPTFDKKFVELEDQSGKLIGSL